MVKKRQADFPKVKLKPGRSIGKRKNITAVNFKSKKIFMQNQIRKEKCQKTIPDCLKHLKEERERVINLNQLIQLIRKQPDSLYRHLSQIIESVFRYVLKVDYIKMNHDQNNAALQVTKIVLEATDDLQIRSHVPLIINILSCAMKHGAYRIRAGSLVLLDCMLKNHPDLIRHSMTILTDLLQMVNESFRTPIISAPNLPIMKETVYSTKYPINALGYMNVFLKKMLKNKTFIVDNDRNEQEVYWNCEDSLNLEIYAGGGLQPVDIEKCYSDGFDHQDACFEDSESISKFIDSIINLLPEIYNAEIPFESSVSDDNILSREAIKNLSIVFQVFRHVAEWAKLICYEAKDITIEKFLRRTIHERGRFPFDTTGPVAGRSSQEFLPCVQLNLAICFLYGNFLVQPREDNEVYNGVIFNYVGKVLVENENQMSYSVKFDSIPLLVKIIKIYFSMKGEERVAEFLHTSLIQLGSLLNEPSDHSNKQHLISLFTKMSLDSAYNFLEERATLKNWFSWLLRELEDNIDKVDKKLLSVIKKIANRKYPCFLQILSAMDFSVIKALLKHDNDDVRDTAIFLIYNMEEISGGLLEKLSRIILLDPSFPKRFAVRLIRLLMCRFSEKSNREVKRFSMYNAKGLVDFILFLLNIAVDSFNLNNEKMIDFEANQYASALKPLKDCHPFNIFPSIHWKEHSVLFELCFKFLRLLPQNSVNDITIAMFKEILNNTTSLPMHSAIAILKLNNREMKEKYYRLLICDLTFSCLLTTSVLAYIPMEEEWYKWNVQELMNSMEFSRRTAYQTLQLVKDDSYGKPEGIVVFHILKVFSFFLERHLLQPEDAKRVLDVLKSLDEKCYDRTMKQQPLFQRLYNYFAYCL